MLLEFGSAVNWEVKDKQGRTALALAKQMRHEKVVCVLEECGVNAGNAGYYVLESMNPLVVSPFEEEEEEKRR